MPCAHTHPSLHLVDLLVVSEKFLLVFIILGSEHSYEICQKLIGKELSIHWASAPKVLPWSSSQSIMGVSREGHAQCFHHTQPFSSGWCLRLVQKRFCAEVACWRSLPRPFQLAYCVVQFLEKDSTLTEPVSALLGPEHPACSLLGWKFECGNLAASSFTAIMVFWNKLATLSLTAWQSLEHGIWVAVDTSLGPVQSSIFDSTCPDSLTCTEVRG